MVDSIDAAVADVVVAVAVVVVLSSIGEERNSMFGVSVDSCLDSVLSSITNGFIFSKKKSNGQTEEIFPKIGPPIPKTPSERTSGYFQTRFGSI